ncbi:hypothetical protein M406DRAFT_217057, partial [Cryphonectria parasitica EP155]
KHSRQSPHTCSACRSRKVRCDGRRDICRNCERLDLECSFQGQELSIRGPDRRRTRRACLPCRNRKARCSGLTPACQRCLDLGFKCIYESPAAAAAVTSRRVVVPSRVHNSSPPTSTPPSNVLLPQSPRANSSEPRTSENNPEDISSFPSDSQSLQALDAFFQHLHHVPVFAFLHKATVMEDYRARVLDRALLLALAGITTALMDGGPDGRERGSTYVDLAESIVVSGREEPGLARVQALILIIKFREYQARFSSVFILTAIAMRFAMALRLNYEDHSMHPLTREVRRRAWWSLFMIDTQVASGYDDFSLSTVGRAYIQLPCSEQDFSLGLARPVDKLEINIAAARAPIESSELNPLAQVVRVKWLRYKTLQSTIRIVATTQVDLGDEVKSLQEDLDAFSAQLPAGLQLSEQNARLHAYWTSFSAYATIHIIWFAVRMIVYRLALPGVKEALPGHVLRRLDPSIAMHCHTRCLEAANLMADALKLLLACRAKTSVVDLDLASCTYQCARILFHL